MRGIPSGKHMICFAGCSIDVCMIDTGRAMLSAANTDMFKPRPRFTNHIHVETINSDMLAGLGRDKIVVFTSIFTQFQGARQQNLSIGASTAYWDA